MSEKNLKIAQLRLILDELRKKQKEELIQTERKLRMTENEIRILKLAIERSKSEHKTKMAELNSQQSEKDGQVTVLQADLKKYDYVLNPEKRFEEFSLIEKINGIESQLQIETENFHHSIQQLCHEENVKREELNKILEKLQKLRISENEEIKRSTLFDENNLNIEQIQKKYQDEECNLLTQKLECENQIGDIKTMINAEQKNFEEQKKQFLDMIEHEKSNAKINSLNQNNNNNSLEEEDLFEEEEEDVYNVDDSSNFYGNNSSDLLNVNADDQNANENIKNPKAKGHVSFANLK